MEQLTLFATPYKYIMDTSSILSQKPGEPHTRLVYKSQWENIEHCMKEKVIVTCSEIVDEIKDRDIISWLNIQHCDVLDIDDEVQMNVRRIVTDNPKMIESVSYTHLDVYKRQPWHIRTLQGFSSWRKIRDLHTADSEGGAE